MDIRKTFATNKTKEEQGVWVKGPDGAEFLVAREGNKAFTKLSAELTKPHRRLIQMGKADDALIADISAEVMSRTILLGWKGVTENGKPIEYSPAAAKRLILELPDFADLIANYCRSVALYQDEEQKAAEGN